MPRGRSSERVDGPEMLSTSPNLRRMDVLLRAPVNLVGMRLTAHKERDRHFSFQQGKGRFFLYFVVFVLRIEKSTKELFCAVLHDVGLFFWRVVGAFFFFWSLMSYMEGVWRGLTGSKSFGSTRHLMISDPFFSACEQRSPPFCGGAVMLRDHHHHTPLTPTSRTRQDRQAEEQKKKTHANITK